MVIVTKKLVKQLSSVIVWMLARFETPLTLFNLNKMLHVSLISLKAPMRNHLALSLNILQRSFVKLFDHR